MLTRVLTAAVGLPLVIAAIIAGGWIFALVIGLIAFLALYEYFRMFKICAPAIWALALTFTWFMVLWLNLLSMELYLFTYIIFVSITSLVLVHGKYNLTQVLTLLFGGLYIPLLLSSLVLIRQFDLGMYYVAAVLALTWSTDSGAYFIGNWLGGKKLAPKISPNKTWSGALGGMAAAVIIAIIIGIITDTNLYAIIIWGFVASTTGQLGDLCESVFKRAAEIKDSGNLLPGHGGFYDRIDSLLFTASVSYIFLSLGI